MTPAVCTGATTGCAVALVLSLAGAGTVAVEIWQAPLLVVFGLRLGPGLALFTQGARLTPSAFAALLAPPYTPFPPFWVWLFLEQNPPTRTLRGGPPGSDTTPPSPAPAP